MKDSELTEYNLLNFLGPGAAGGRGWGVGGRLSHVYSIFVHQRGDFVIEEES